MDFINNINKKEFNMILNLNYKIITSSNNIITRYEFSNKRHKYIIIKDVEYIYSYAFMYNHHLNHIHFPKTLKEIRYCSFAYCTNLKLIEIPNSVRFISPSAFACCKNLQKIILPIKFKIQIKSIFHNIDLSKVTITYT